MLCLLLFLVFPSLDASIMHNLDELSIGSTLTVIPMYQDPGIPPLLDTVSYPTSYISFEDASVFSITAQAQIFGNNTVIAMFMTMTYSDDKITMAAYPTSTNGNFVQLAGSAYPHCKYNAVYTTTFALQCTTSLTHFPVFVQWMAPPDVTCQNQFTPHSLVSINMAPIQTSCETTSCNPGWLNGTVMTYPPPYGGFSALELIMTPNLASSGVYFGYMALVESGGVTQLNTANFDNVFMMVGGFGADGTFQAQTPSSSSSSTAVPQFQSITVALQYQSGFSNYFVEPLLNFGGGVSFQFSGGTGDQIAPMCTSAFITPPTVVTTNHVAQATVTLNCQDLGGLGLWQSGVFATVQYADGSSITTAFVMNQLNLATVTIPPYVSATLNIIGAFAIDNAGNAALYGSCGDYTSAFYSLCGQSSSSTTINKLLYIAVPIGVCILVIAAIIILRHRRRRYAKLIDNVVSEGNNNNNNDKREGEPDHYHTIPNAAINHSTPYMNPTGQYGLGGSLNFNQNQEGLSSESGAIG